MDDNLTPIAVARVQLRRLGIPVDELTDDQVLEYWGQMVREQIPSPPVPAGSSHVNARAWVAAALTAGGFAAPEDRRQQADLGDGGRDVDLGILVMRHRSRNNAPRLNWTDEALAADLRDDPANIARAQRVIDQAAIDVGVPAIPAERWWLSESPS